jgi:hypothetical protein
MHRTAAVLLHSQGPMPPDGLPASQSMSMADANFILVNGRAFGLRGFSEKDAHSGIRLRSGHD